MNRILSAVQDVSLRLLRHRFESPPRNDVIARRLLSRRRLVERRTAAWSSGAGRSVRRSNPASGVAGAVLSVPWVHYLELTKPRVVTMVLFSTMVGFYLASPGLVNPFLFVATFLSTALVASGAMIFNELFEREIDRKMIRTQNRPLPAGRLEPREALIFGSLISLAGFMSFAGSVNWPSTLLAFITWASYLFVYTPLKRKTSLSTFIGAVPGALPPVIGWAGAGGVLGMQALVLFLIVFFWQLPHFLAIAWMYRADYARAEIPMLSVIDCEGSFVARQMILNVCALMPVSLLLTLFGMTGTVYFFGAFALGIGFAAVIIFAASDLEKRAPHVLRASVIYLAALLILMIVDKA